MKFHQYKKKIIKFSNKVIDEIVNIKEYIQDCWESTKLYSFYRNVVNGIRNFWIYKKVIWNDRWYDDIFIFILLKKKLEGMEYNIRHHGIHIYNVRDADNIKKCILLLDRIIKDEYHENLFVNFYKKWGKPIFNWDKNPILGYENVKTKEESDQADKEFRILSKNEGKRKQQDIEYLFKLMSKYIQEWWD